MKQIAVSLLFTLAFWSVLSWPLPRYVSTAVAYTSHAEEGQRIRNMVPGDHLQFLYYLALVEDMFTGHTPFFHNLYEFNTGDDSERFEPDPYYFPFSGVFTLFSLATGRIAAWNLTGIFSLWISYWATWRLTRRYTDREWLAATAALMTFVLPFRWANLLGGSPMGLAMLWPPVIMLGIDKAVRDNSIRGSLLAGASLLVALWTDLHTFFFGALCVPAWCVIAFLKREDFDWRSPPAYTHLLRTLLPVPLFVAAAVGIRKLHASTLAVKTPRTWDEAALFAPGVEGLVTPAGGATGHIYLGFGILAMLTLGLIAMVWVCRKPTRSTLRNAVVYTALSITLGCVVVLALGPLGPNGGRAFDIARHFVPFYNMIRQSAKIYCLMPPMLAVASALSASFLFMVFRASVARALWFVLWAWILIGAGGHIHAGLTIIEPGQNAYKAVAEDATKRAARPGIIVLPLWPGDHHFSSVYQHFALQYRLRMVNGYTALDVPGYRENIFPRFVSANQGALDGGQLDELLDRGISYVLLHEDLMPEQVSPYPVGFTLRNLLNHPRLTKIAQDERVWAFRILDKPVERPPVAPDWDVVFTARRWEAEDFFRDGPSRHHDVQAGREAYVSLTPDNTAITISSAEVAGTPHLSWMLRLRGKGSIRVDSSLADRSTTLHDVSSGAWMWLNIPTGHSHGFATGGVSIAVVAGAVDFDLLILATDTWRSPVPGETSIYTAARFFHGGYSDMESESVVFQPGKDPEAAVLYGPKLPLGTGTYEIAFDFSSPAAAGTKLGIINLEQNELTGSGVAMDVIAGQTAIGRIVRESNLPFNLAFVFLAVDEITVRRVTLTRIE